VNRSVLVDRKDGVARVTISRPEVRNALDAATVGELELVLKALETDHTVRCVILRGAGDRVFVSGADIREFRDKLATPEGARAYDEEIERMQAIICSMPKPVIAQIQGFAIGGGCVLAVACDFRIASDKGRFGIPIAKFGFMLSPTDTVRIAKLVGLSQARRLLMTGAVIDAAEAYRIGLVDQVVAHDELAVATDAFAATLTANAPLSLKATKQILATLHAREPSISDGAELYRELYSSQDIREGLDAFFQKRAPNFKGT
jgi:enoyl-CoA hydratase